MAVVSLSEMTITTFEFSFTQSSSPVIPEWVKVESPITATDRMQSGIGRTFGHGDRCTHVYARVDGIERSVRSQCITTDIAEYLMNRVLLAQHFRKGDIPYHGVHILRIGRVDASRQAKGFRRATYFLCPQRGLLSRESVRRLATMCRRDALLPSVRLPRYPLSCFSTKGCPSSRMRISSQASTNCMICFLGRGYCPIFNTGYSHPSG